MHTRNVARRIAAWCLPLAICASAAHADITPRTPGPNDSVWVTISVNDTLGNAADADTLKLLWLHDGVPFDSTILSTAGLRTGQYVIAHPAANAGAYGDYQILVFAEIGDRTPITNYAYAVVPENPCLGDGPAACTLFVMRDLGADTVAVPGVALRVYNAGETATLATGETDANGRIVCSLIADTVRVLGALTGYSIAAATVPINLSGANDTLWATAFDPGSPASASLCRVYGWVYNLSGDTIPDASVRARIVDSPLHSGAAIISPYELTTTTDSSGYWFLDLIPSSTLTPDTTRYEFTIRFPSGAILRQRLAVPDTSEWLLSW